MFENGERCFNERFDCIERMPLEELSQIFTMNESKQKWATEHNHNWMNANDRHLKLNIQDQMEAINQVMIQHEITISKHTTLSDRLESIKGLINNNK
jgi:hypothetical protein